MKKYDVVVIGGGAAGLSAALVLLRARRTVVLVDAGAPRNAPAAHMHGSLTRDGTPPRDLLAAGRSEVSKYGGSLIADTVVGVELGFHLTRQRLATECPPNPGGHRTAGRTARHTRRRRAMGAGPAALPVLPWLRGWVVHDPTGRTTVAGVWVAGSAADPRAQVITAAGEGSAAAIALNADLVDEDVKRATADRRADHAASAPALPTAAL